MRIATAAWPIEQHENWQTYVAKAEHWVKEAADNGAELLVFPEYGAMELTSLFPPREDLKDSLADLQTIFVPYREIWASLAKRYGVHLVAPSFPVLRDGRYYNEAWLFSPEGQSASQQKLHMTRFEDEIWGIAAGDGLKLFEIGGITAAIAICYDVEFPDQVQALAAAGADLILVPSCTDTDAGYTRVSITARARAIENQCFVVQSSTVGEAPWSPAVDVNTGMGSIYGPADKGFPADGVLARGKYNQPGWTYGELDLAALKAVRAQGQVLNHRDQTKTAYGTPTIALRSSP